MILKIAYALYIYESDTCLFDSHPAATVFDSSATRSFGPLVSFFCLSHVYSFVARSIFYRIRHDAGKLAGPMATKVTDNRIIYVTDIYSVYA